MSAYRFFFIELIAWWEGEIANKQLVTQLKITRQQAYQDLKNYNELYPNNLIKSGTGYKPSLGFNPKFISDDVSQYFHWLSSGQLLPSHAEPSGIHTLSLPSRVVSVLVIRVLMQAIRQKRRMEVNYISVSHPEKDGRIFHPHTIVNTGMRWHVRGYCEKSQAYRDLVISRFQEEVDLLDKSDKDESHDLDWNILVDVILQPNPELSTDKQVVLAHDYQMKEGQITLTVRAPMVNYLLHELQVNTKLLTGTPEAQQLVLVNFLDIKHWLFNN